ncbi:hypothetical protein [Dactylosporangium sp. NPDC006015]|uniref:hypothetical protein n=1 Tax=Dactylosporangium sp. NPDC006015 TaxID=3154576 RepID=UPI0033BC9790
MSGQVHTMLFQWSEAKGFMTARSSLPRPEQELWYDRLLPRLSLPQGQYDTGSTCYLQYDDVMALLHRWPAKDGHHRASTRTRALLGPPRLLTFADAVRVRTDAEPVEGIDGEGPFPGMPPGWRAASDDDATILAALEECHDRLVTFVAGLLTDGAAGRFAVVAPEQYRRALLWGAQHCFRPDECPPWTFSTAEAGVAGTDLPRIVFVPSEASSRGYGGDDLSWIDVNRPEYVDPLARDHAARVVDDALYRVAVPHRTAHNGRPPVPHSLPQAVPHSIPQAVPHSIPQPVPHPVPSSVPQPVPQQPPMPEQVSVPSGSPDAHRQAERPAKEPAVLRTEESEYAVFVLSLAIGSALFVLLLMYLGAAQ